MKKLTQSTVTVDIPKHSRLGIDAVAESICLTSIRDGEEVPNRSGMARILLEIGLSHSAEFRTWLLVDLPDREAEPYRLTFQASEPFIARLEELASRAKLTRLEEGERVPNLTQVIRRLLEFVLSRPDMIGDWFESRVWDAIGEKAG